MLKCSQDVVSRASTTLLIWPVYRAMLDLISTNEWRNRGLVKSAIWERFVSEKISKHRCPATGEVQSKVKIIWHASTQTHVWEEKTKLNFWVFAKLAMVEFFAPIVEIDISKGLVLCAKNVQH